MDDDFDLSRFVTAQAGAYDQALAEIRRGRKQSHWMWFVFPQLAGLGSSPMAQRYAIGSVAEAQAYLEHPVLGPRLREIASAVNTIGGRTAHDIFGSPDDLKFRSSMTLFREASHDGSIFQAALDIFFDGQPDERTLALLAGAR